MRATCLLCLSALVIPTAASAGDNVKIRRDAYGDPLPPGAVARVGTVRFRHGGELGALAFAPDSRLLATSAADSTISIWDIATGKERLRLPVPAGLTFASGLGYSPDGRLLACASWWLDVFDARTGKVKYRSQLARQHTAVAFAADGKTALSSGPMDSSNRQKNWFVAVWDVKNWKQERMFSVPGKVPASGFSPDGKRVAAIAGKSIEIWDTATGKKIRSLPEHDSNIRTLAFSPDSRRLASVDESRDILRVHEVDTGKKVFEVREIHAAPLHLAFRNRGNTLLAVGHFGKTREYELATGKRIHDFDTPSGTHAPFAMSPDGQWLAGGEALQLWHLPDGKEKTFGVRGGLFVRFMRDGKRLFTGYPRAGVFSAATGKMLQALPKINLRFPRYSMVHDTMLEYAANEKKTKLILRDPVRKKTLATVPAKWAKPWNTNDVHYQIISPNLQQGLRIREMRTMELNDMATGNKLRQWKPLDRVNLLIPEFSADGERVVTRLGNPRALVRSIVAPHAIDSVAVWHVRSGELLARLRPVFREFGPGVFDVQTSWDNRMVVGNNSHRQIVVWEVASGQIARTIVAAKGAVFDKICISPNGQTMAVSYQESNRAMAIWDIATGKKIKQYTGHRGFVQSMAFSPRGNLLASAATDNTTLIWHVPAVAASKIEVSKIRLDQLWSDLADKDATRGVSAIWQMVGAGENTVAYVKQQLQPKKMNEKEAAQLITALGSDNFRVRTKAQKRFADMAEAAGPILRRALAQKLTLETHLRIERLLERLDTISPQCLRRVRAVAVLEYIGSPAARRELQRLASPAFPPRTRSEAREALGRLTRIEQP